MLQETQIDDLGRRGVRWRGFRLGLDLKPALLVVVVEHGDVDDLDVEVARRVVGDLELLAEIDDAGDPRCEQRLPSLAGEVSERVGPDHRTERRLAPVLGRQPAEIADIDATVPDEIARLHYKMVDR